MISKNIISKNIDDTPQLRLKFLILICGYFILHILLRVLVSDSLDYDEAEQAFLGQWLLAGYTEQPPLYSWLQYYLFAALGHTVFAVSLLKNTLLFFTYFFVYFSAEKLLKSTRAAVLCSCSLLLIPQIAWESQRDMTHTTLVVFAASAVLWAALKLMEDRTILNYAVFGVFCGVGILAKANFYLFFLILCVSLLTFPQGRKLFFSWKFAISLLIVAAMNTAYFIWMWHNVDIVFSATHKFKQGVEILSFKGLKSFFLNMFLFLTPLWLVYLFIFPRGYTGNQNRQTDFSSRLMGRYFLIFLIILILVVVLFKISYVKDRWLQPMLFAFPLIFFSRLDVASISQKQFKRFFTIAMIAAVSIYIGFTVRVAGAGLTHHYCRLNYPFSSFAEKIRESGFSNGYIVSNNRFLAGNLLFQFQNSIALIPGYRFEKQIENSGAVKGLAVWKTKSSSAIPSDLITYINDTYHVDISSFPVIRYNEFYKYSDQDKINLAAVVFSLSQDNN